MNDKIEITGLNRNEVLAALCNGTIPQGMSALNPKAMDRITAEDCALHFESSQERNGIICFDYIYGRPIKVNFVTEGDKTFLDRTRLYDRDAGQGKAQEIINLLKREPL